MDALMRLRRTTATIAPAKEVAMLSYEYKVIDTGRGIERQLNEHGAEGWQVVGVTTKKQCPNVSDGSLDCD